MAIVKGILDRDRHLAGDLAEERDLIRAKGMLLAGAEGQHAQHTTAGVVINEAEPLLLGDMCRVLERFASRDEAYEHDDAKGDRCGRHLRSRPGMTEVGDLIAGPGA